MKLTGGHKEITKIIRDYPPNIVNASLVEAPEGFWADLYMDESGNYWLTQDRGGYGVVSMRVSDNFAKAWRNEFAPLPNYSFNVYNVECRAK